ncbi:MULTISPECIES: hypothetical protein [Chryseobacterium]|uniref:Transposase n=1 Tax=Chryseobacterium camelliae TaxID=1265445 RepID=A0ABU0TFI0_9FLAO|nr:MULTISPECIES: hypothetical protein [Chryseobacterium]MDT3406386.1 transposase [Pseudacidovorax intermedius]MDQ1095814.1 transposase [Chryseobacterium camelliae]MDQ1099751.1 transposase [Chryseobacterium sp. SORGH_AS_1048]MDR6087099.1 transposase [Chryseobacterium sp. SORGH_AS_0909]MDR6131472.1 transposase [Chryseobacterium sp. SORGH_AS_1175]
MGTQKEIINKKFSQNPIYSVDWEDIKNKESDYDFYLNKIKRFFRKDFDNNIIY